MEVQELFFLGLAVSLDAFGVILCIGINKGITLKSIMTFCIFLWIFFSFFLFFFRWLYGDYF